MMVYVRQKEKERERDGEIGTEVVLINSLSQLCWQSYLMGRNCCWWGETWILHMFYDFESILLSPVEESSNSNSGILIHIFSHFLLSFYLLLPFLHLSDSAGIVDIPRRRLWGRAHGCHTCNMQDLRGELSMKCISIIPIFRYVNFVWIESHFLFLFCDSQVIDILTNYVCKIMTVQTRWANVCFFSS